MAEVSVAVSLDLDMNAAADAAALPEWYPAELLAAVISVRERIEEWDYRRDPHGYCHERSDLVALVREVERLRPDIAEAARDYFATSAAWADRS